MSTLSVGTIQNLTGTASTSSDNVINGCAKAWVNFNGTTSPGTIRGSYNVTSVTKNGTGDFTVNFTTAMPSVNYCVVVGRSNTASNNNCNTNIGYVSSPTVNGFRIGQFENGSLIDIVNQYFAIFSS